MKIRNIIVATLLALSVASCSTKQTPIDCLTQLSEQLDKSDAKYSEEEWVALGSELEEIEEEVQKNKYTEEELQEINRLKGKCLGKLAKKAANDFADELGNFLKGSAGMLDGFMDEINKEKEE